MSSGAGFTGGSWFAEGPVGRVFGRRFDLAEFAWIGKALPDCGLYLSENTTGPEEGGFGGWQNTNVTGWSNEEFAKGSKKPQHPLETGA